MAHVRALYQLQTIDQSLALAHKRLQEIGERLTGDERVRNLQRAVDSLSAQVSRSRAKVRDAELELRSLSDKIAAVQERLYGGQVTNPRELASLQNEVSYLRRRQGHLEDGMLEAMIRLEEQEAELARQREKLAQATAQWETAQVTLRAEQAELQAQVRQLEAQRAVIRGKLHPEELSIYEDLRRRKGGLAVVVLQGPACGGCGVRLPTSLVQQARQAEELQFCPSCGRILCGK